MEDYYTQYNRLQASRGFRNRLAQIVGEHAVHMCNLVRMDGEGAVRSMMTTWVELDHLNDEWYRLVVGGKESSDSEFARVTKQLIHRYTDALGDCIVDKVDKQRLAEIVQLECKFFGTLSGNPSRQNQLMGLWSEYTRSIMSLARLAQRGGQKRTQAIEQRCYQYAAECIKNGVLLGNWLDNEFQMKTN